jgi:hypothetical protein
MRGKTVVLPQISGDNLRPVEKRLIRVTFDLFAIQIKVRVEKFVRVLISQAVQPVQNRTQHVPMALAPPFAAILRVI